MDTINEADFQSAKPVLGVRIPHQLKRELCIEAQNLNISLSEHSENLLLNRHVALTELQKVKKELEDERNKVKQKNQELEVLKSKHSTDNSKYTAELQTHQQQLTDLKSVADLLKDPRLNELFNALKGKKDEIENAGGKNFTITYNSIRDLLIALIYSFKLKKN